MYESFTNFTIFYFIMSAIFLLLVIFEKKLVALEDKYDEKRRQAKAAKRNAAQKRPAQPVQNKAVRRQPSKQIPCSKRTGRSAA